MIQAVFWDFGGVISTSPFEAFNRFEGEKGLPRDLIRTINATNPDGNAWARLERSEITVVEFNAAFAAEAAARGYEVRGAEVLGMLDGDLRPEMVEAVRRCKGRYRTACLTNNIRSEDGELQPERIGAAARIAAFREVMGLFDFVIESSKIGVRKPDPLFYERACALVGVPPRECVFLDDLGVNLRPARAMGMTTIKVVDPRRAIAELEAVLGIALH
jgi:putative hydrolase of the HAD superfamily